MNEEWCQSKDVWIACVGGGENGGIRSNLGSATLGLGFCLGKNSEARPKL